MKSITFIICMLLSGMAFTQFNSDQIAIGVYYSPMLPFSGMQTGSTTNYPSMYTFKNGYNNYYHLNSSYSQSVGLKLIVSASDNLDVNVGFVYSNRQQHFGVEPDDYYYNNSTDTIFDVNFTGHFAEVHGEVKQHIYQPGRFSIFLTAGTGFSLLLKETVTLDARPYEGGMIKRYEKITSVNSSAKVIFHLGIGFDFELTEKLSLTVQPQYMFYLPGDLYPLSYTPHTGRINIGLNYSI